LQLYFIFSPEFTLVQFELVVNCFFLPPGLPPLDLYSHFFKVNKAGTHAIFPRVWLCKFQEAWDCSPLFSFSYFYSDFCLITSFHEGCYNLLSTGCCYLLQPDDPPHSCFQIFLVFTFSSLRCLTPPPFSYPLKSPQPPLPCITLPFLTSFST